MIDPNDDLAGWYAEATKATIHHMDAVGWYWYMACFKAPVGPFQTEEEARNDVLNVMGIEAP